MSSAFKKLMFEKIIELPFLQFEKALDAQGQIITF
jgi:hypothetical protein